MITLILSIFGTGYGGIAFEHPLKIDKTVSALLMAGLMWILIHYGFYNGILDVVDSESHIYSYLKDGDTGFHNILYQRIKI